MSHSAQPSTGGSALMAQSRPVQLREAEAQAGIGTHLGLTQSLCHFKTLLSQFTVVENWINALLRGFFKSSILLGGVLIALIISISQWLDTIKMALCLHHSPVGAVHVVIQASRLPGQACGAHPFCFYLSAGTCNGAMSPERKHRYYLAWANLPQHWQQLAFLTNLLTSS